MLEQKLYTVADVAEVTGLTSRTIRNYLKDGTLHGKKIGVQWRFTEEDINRLFFEVDTGGHKSVHPAEVISDFLKETEKERRESCFVWDIPFQEEADINRYIKKLEHILSEEGADVVFAYEIFTEHPLLRVSLSGETEKIEKIAARVNEN